MRLAAVGLVPILRPRGSDPQVCTALGRWPEPGHLAAAHLRHLGHRDQQLGAALPGRDDQARRQARIANGKDPDDLSDVDRGGPTRPRELKPIESPPNPYLPAAPLGLADAASWLGIRAVQLALAVREAKVATVHGRGGELLVAHAEVERARREG